LTEVTIPNSVKSIYDGAFENNQLAEITIPNNVTWIDRRAFAGNKLISVVIPESVTSLGDDAFADNDLSSPPVVPESVDRIWGRGYIGDIIGQGDSRTVTVTLNPSEKIILPDAIYGIPITRIKSRDKWTSPDNVGELVLPANLETIEPDATLNLSIRKVTVPNDRVKILWTTFYAEVEQKERNRQIEGLRRVGQELDSIRNQLGR
jgi:hypothetical protein